MDAYEADFKRYLQTVEERDIDLLLMEEFHVSTDFVEWFCAQARVSGTIEFAGAWHSVSDEDGESDLLLRVQASGKRIAVLVENKIAAPEQPEQDARYRLRGARARDAGLCDSFVTCICAPRAYLSSLASASMYESRIAYEDIRDWYAGREGARHVWRKRIMTEAIERGRRGYVMSVHPSNLNFHRDYWEYVQQHHPGLIMREPKKRGAKSNWVILKSLEMPKNVQLVHKLDQSCVELEFARTSAANLAGLRREWPQEIRVRQKSKSAVLSIKVPPIDMSSGFSVCPKTC